MHPQNVHRAILPADWLTLGAGLSKAALPGVGPRVNHWVNMHANAFRRARFGLFIAHIPTRR
jgi:hypothetical protein